MRLLNQSNIGDLSTTFYLPSGSYAGFLLDYQGTNDAGNQATRDDIGQIQLTFNGSPIINTDAEFLSYLSDLKGGYSTFSSALAGAFNCSIYIPCGDFDDNNNCYIINKTDSVYFKLDYSLLGGLLASGSVKIYGVDKAGVMNYIYNIAQRNVVASGVGTIADVHRLDNVGQMYVKNYSIIDTIRITRDNTTLFDCLTNDAKGLSDFFNRVEADTNALIELDLNLSKDVKEVLSREILFNYYFNAGGTLEQYFAYKTLTPNKAVQSQVILSQSLSTKLQTGIVKQAPLFINGKTGQTQNTISPLGIAKVSDADSM
jgi:hypothetical protein